MHKHTHVGVPLDVCQTPCMRTFVHILICCFDNCFILFYFVSSETLTQAHACGRTLVVNQTTGDKCCWFFWGHPRVVTGSRLPGEYLFCFVLLRTTQESLQADNPRLFLFLWITDIPCLILSCSIAKLSAGAHLHATTRSDVANNLTSTLLFLAHSFLKGSLEGTWCSWSSPRSRLLDRATAWAWLIFWNRNGRENDLWLDCDFFK